MDKVAIYASLKNHNKEFIDFYIKELEDYCISNDYDYTMYIDMIDNRLDMNRKELNNLKEDIENQEYSKIVIKNLSQLSRNTIKNIEFLDFLENNDCEIEIVEDCDLNMYKRIYNFFNNKKEEEKIR